LEKRVTSASAASRKPAKTCFDVEEVRGTTAFSLCEWQGEERPAAGTGAATRIPRRAGL